VTAFGSHHEGQISDAGQEDLLVIEAEVSRPLHGVGEAAQHILQRVKMDLQKTSHIEDAVGVLTEQMLHIRKGNKHWVFNFQPKVPEDRPEVYTISSAVSYVLTDGTKHREYTPHLINTPAVTLVDFYYGTAPTANGSQAI